MNGFSLYSPHKTWEERFKFKVELLNKKNQDFDTLGNYYPISDCKRCENKEIILRKLCSKEERKKKTEGVTEYSFTNNLEKN